MDPCNTVITIPQFTETCWFNALLTVLLYSDGMRAYLTKNLIKSHLFEKNKELYTILIDILKNKHRRIKNNDKMFFDELKPENILKLLHEADKKMFYFDPDIYSGHWGENYLTRLMRYFGLGKKILYLARNHTKRNEYMYSALNNEPTMTIHNRTRFKDGNKGIRANFEYKSLSAKQIDNLIKPNNDIDVLVVTQKVYPNRSNRLFTTNSRNIEEIIEFNGNVYKLDSVLVANFNVLLCLKSHQIAGVTCENKRYMYNGWIRTTTDPAKINTYFDRKLPCELMKYDWLQNKLPFCLSSKGCGLENRSSKNELCFNTSKFDNNSYIYVRVTDNTKILKQLNDKLTKVEKKCKEDINSLNKEINLYNNKNSFKFNDLKAKLTEKKVFCNEHVMEIKTRIDDIK